MGGAAFFVALVAIAMLGLIVVGTLLLRGAFWTREMSTDVRPSDDPDARPQHVRVEDDGTRGPAHSERDRR
jgi:hypothetical protein